MAINFFVEEISFNLKDKLKLKNWIKEICVSEGKIVGNLNYIFTSNQAVLGINKEYLKHNYFTDIITFNYNQEKLINGDLYISIDKVRENAVEYGQEFNMELHRVIIHGVFHLLGYGDSSPNEETVMRKKEDLALALLNEKEFGTIKP